MKARFISEALDFERTGTPYEKLRIGKARLRPYPQMSVEEFHDWYDQEIKPYYESEPGFDMILDNIINNEMESDEQIADYWGASDVSEEIIKKIIPMRSYFLDFHYIKDLER